MSERVRLTRHAALRLHEMGLRPADLVPVLSDPEVSYQQSDRRGEQTVFQRDDLAAVVGHDRQGSPVVVTVLWRRSEQWTRDEFRSTREVARA